MVTQCVTMEQRSGYRASVQCDGLRNEESPVSQHRGLLQLGREVHHVTIPLQHRFANIDRKPPPTIPLQLCFCLPEVLSQLPTLHSHYP